MITYAVIHNDTGNEQREGYSKEYAFSMGMLHNGTFDRIVMLDGDIVKATDFDYE